MKVIACIEDPVVIKQLLAHRQQVGLEVDMSRLPDSRAPPQRSLFGPG